MTCKTCMSSSCRVLLMFVFQARSTDHPAPAPATPHQACILLSHLQLPDSLKTTRTHTHTDTLCSLQTAQT